MSIDRIAIKYSVLHAIDICRYRCLLLFLNNSSLYILRNVSLSFSAFFSFSFNIDCSFCRSSTLSFVQNVIISSILSLEIASGAMAFSLNSYKADRLHLLLFPPF